MYPKSYIHNFQKGFTYVEVIVAMFIFSVITGAVAIFSAYYFRNYSFSFEENQQINMAQTSLTSILRYLREARSGDDGAWTLVDCSDNSITFYSDVTNDGRTDKVRYFLSGTTLQKGVIQPTDVPVTYPAGSESVTPVVTNIDTSAGPIFTYYNGNWPADQVNNPLAAAVRLLNTRYISVHIRISLTSGFAAQPFELTSGTTIRSMKTNL